MGGMSVVNAMQVLSAQLAVFQALLLCVSAVHKGVRWQHSKSVMRQFAGVPLSMAASTLSAAMACELVAGVLLIVPGSRAMGAMLAAAIWAVYLGLIFRAIVQHRRDVDCGCSFGSTSRPLGAFQITRNAVLAGLAVFIAWVSAMYGSVPAQGSQVLGGIALLTLYGALDQVMALRPLRSGEVS
jgi:Methylamine utilisation protein MauE